MTSHARSAGLRPLFSALGALSVLDDDREHGHFACASVTNMTSSTPSEADVLERSTDALELRDCARDGRQDLVVLDEVGGLLDAVPEVVVPGTSTVAAMMSMFGTMKSEHSRSSLRSPCHFLFFYRL